MLIFGIDLAGQKNKFDKAEKMCYNISVSKNRKKAVAYVKRID